MAEAQPTAPKAAARKKGGKKRERREVRTGVAHVQATFNNTIVTLADGALSRREVPALPARRHEAVPEGGAVLHRQVRDRAPELPAGPTRPEPRQADRLRDPAPGEAEGEADLRGARDPVPALLLRGGAGEGDHGREPPQAPRAATRQRRPPARLRGLPARGASNGRPRTLRGERAQGLGALLPGPGGRCGAGPLDLEDAGAGRREHERRPGPGAAVARA